MRVRRYFAFIDLCGFTRFTEVHGDEEAVAVLTGFRTLVRFIASEHGVRVAKWLGDGAMFVSTDGPALRPRSSCSTREHRTRSTCPSARASPAAT